mgnify:CR=1
MDRLKKICEDTEGCVAFTETGILKDATMPLERDENSVVWIWTEGAC